MGGKRVEGWLREKVGKYGERVIPGGFRLQPIIFKSPGLLHPNSCEYLTQYAQYASFLRKTAWHRLYSTAFFIKRLSVTMQRAIANVVNMRLMRLTSHSNTHKQL
jgi:hypothetical protein